MISIYDFDGVLSCPMEDTIFRLPENDMDEAFISKGRERYGITRLSTHVQRNRHLILQEVLYEQRVCPKPGPRFQHMMDNPNPFYVLTARSGPGAVARVSQFFEAHDKRPEEMFFVGPMSKTHMLEYLCKEFQGQKLEFFDDSFHHIQAANELSLCNLDVHYVDNQAYTLYDKATDEYVKLCAWLRNR
jgi:hypothetical protein